MRLFVFNFTFDVVDGTARQPPKGLRSDPNSLVIFPPEGNCEGGSMVDVHLHEVMCHASVQVITSLEKQMELCEDARARNDLPSGLALSTIHDELEEHNLNLHVGKDSVTVRGLKKLFRRKPSGRIRKWMGDLSLQVCGCVLGCDSVSTLCIADVYRIIVAVVIVNKRNFQQQQQR